MSIPKQKKTRKPKTKRLYFGPDVDLSIIKYNSLQDDNERSLVYQREIQPAFQKLAENIIHTFKFYYTDGQSIQQVQHEVVSFMVEKLPRFNQSGGKAYSYFSVIAKNYCILKNKNNYKKLTSHERIDITTTDLDDNSITYEEKIEKESTLSKFVDMFVDYWDENLDKVFSKKPDQILASSIVELFRKRDKIDLFNKKALYIYIREMTDASTQQITRMVKVIKDMYKGMYRDFIETGKIDKNKIY